MATLVSPGVSVTIIDESFYIPATAPTVPLVFLATRADKTYNGQTCSGVLEHSTIRTITSKSQALKLYGVPYFRTDDVGNPLHGDARNEYGLFAVHQFLDVASNIYVVRADVDLADSPVTRLNATLTSMLSTGNGTINSIVVDQNLANPQVWTLTYNPTASSDFDVTGFVSGRSIGAKIGQTYNNGEISFTITAGTVPYALGDTFEINVSAVSVSNPLGANDAAKRITIVTALQAEINSNQAVRSELYEYNIVVCPGYYEVVDELINLTLSIGEEAFVIADTPFNLDPEQTATWALTSARYRSCDVAYYYPHGLGSNYDGNNVFVSAVGTALKTYGYSDQVGELWEAPAGTRRGQVSGISDVGYVSGTLGTATTFVPVALNSGQRDILYQYSANINPIVNFPGRGILVWGQKTSAVNASALDRVNVVRELMHIRRNIRKYMQPFLFEPNDQITRDSAKAVIDNFLGDIMTKRGLYDYVVVADESNNTADVIDRNELVLDCALKCVKAVEFIIVPIRVLTTGATMPK